MISVFTINKHTIQNSCFLIYSKAIAVYFFKKPLFSILCRLWHFSYSSSDKSCFFYSQLMNVFYAFLAKVSLLFLLRHRLNFIYHREPLFLFLTRLFFFFTSNMRKNSPISMKIFNYLICFALLDLFQK